MYNYLTDLQKSCAIVQVPARVGGCACVKEETWKKRERERERERGREGERKRGLEKERERERRRKQVIVSWAVKMQDELM